MSRGTATAMVLGSALLIGAAAPAAAAPAEREKLAGTYSYLTSSSFTCSAQEAAEACTSVELTVYPGSPVGADVRLSITRYVRSGDADLIEVGYEWGEARGVPTLTLTPALSATLLPTPLTLSSVEDCAAQDCDVEERSVVVSALARASQPITNSLQQGSFTQGDCDFRFSTRTTSAAVVGTMTVDGVTNVGTGSATQENYRVNRRCA